MGKRSLKASAEGIKQAKLALDRLHLTQKALAEYEHIASWSTISKFFNGKPIDRINFLEICHFLNLVWEEIVDPPIQKKQEDEKKLPDLLFTVQRHSKVARMALNPRILERINRDVVLNKYLPAIQRGIEGMQRVIPIIAPAGYGKSTILGNIYDELTASKVGWVALILGNSLPFDRHMSVENLGMVLGEVASGAKLSIAEIAADLTATCGRGVLLLDTLDLVINRSFVSAFSSIVRQLLDGGSTVVFTCRDYEYNDFLEPNSAKIGAIAETIDRYNVPEFNTNEIRHAAATFFNQDKTESLEIGQRFADKILALSADSRSLQQIVRNPLLLALLCDLFAKDGNVPTDLTVSKLYQRYWYEKICYSRIDESHTSVLAIEKDNFCLTLAKALFEMSREKLCESAYRDELGISFTEIVAAAYNNLLSEGVIERLPSTKIHFFHQTLLEYAIAYWLTRHSAQEKRNQLLQILRNNDTSSTFWYPVIRQLLTIVDETEFVAIANQLDTNQMSAFRAVVFAAASRDTPAALQSALPMAIAKGNAYQKTLHAALASASTPLATTAWEVMLTLLEEASRSTTSSAAQSIGALLTSWRTSIGERLLQAVEAIEKRYSNLANNNINERSQLYGWLVDSTLPILSQQVDSEALKILRNHYFAFAEGTRLNVISLHLDERVTDTARLELFQIICLEPLPKRLDVNFKASLVNLLIKLIPTLIVKDGPETPDSWLKFLHKPMQVGFDLVQAKAIGHYAAVNDNLLSTILQDLVGGDKRHITNNLLALLDASSYGASHQIVAGLMKVNLLDSARFKSVITLVMEINSNLDASERGLLAKWIEPMAMEYPEQWLGILVMLAQKNLKLQHSVMQLIAKLPLEKQTAQIKKYLLNLNPEKEQLLEEIQGDSLDKLALVEVYSKQAITSQEAKVKLIELAMLDNRKTALAAAAAVAALTKEQVCFKVSDLLPLARSKFAGVRLHCLSAIACQMKKIEGAIADTELIEITVAFKPEIQPSVIQALSELIIHWVDVNKSVPILVVDAIGSIMESLHKQKNLLGAAAGTLIDTFNVMAQLEEPPLTQKLVSWVRLLFFSIDVKRVQESKFIGLLALVARGNPHFLEELVTQDLSSLPNRNIRVVVLAIRRVEGIDSPLIERILASDWCPLEVKGLILGFRGA